MEFHDPECISRYCAMLQYCMRVIVVHVVRLGGIQVDFTPLPETDEDQDTGNTNDVEENPLLPPMEMPLPDLVEVPNGEDIIELNPLLFDRNEESEDLSTSVNSWRSIPSSSSFINPMEIQEEEEPMLIENELNDLRPDDLLSSVFLFKCIRFSLIFCMSGRWLSTINGSLSHPTLKMERLSNLRPSKE